MMTNKFEKAMSVLTSYSDYSSGLGLYSIFNIFQDICFIRHISPHCYQYTETAGFTMVAPVRKPFILMTDRADSGRIDFPDSLILQQHPVGLP